MAVAVITGVSRRIGIGAAVARRLAEAGWDLFLHSWSPHDAEQPWGADPEGLVAGDYADHFGSLNGWPRGCRLFDPTLEPLPPR